MKRHLRALGVLAASSLWLVSASTTAAPEFNVTVNVTPACVFTTEALTLNYTSFQTNAAEDTGTVTATCTTGQVYLLSLTGADLTPDPGNVLYTGSVVGLNYSLRIRTSGGVDINTATGYQTGNGTIGQSFQVYGLIAAGQEGSCTTDAANTPGNAVCATNTAARTIVATF